MPEHHYAPGGIQDAHQLVVDSREAGISVPPDPFYFDPTEYPHFWLFCMVQMGRPFRHAEPRHNAKVIATIQDKDLYTITMSELMDKGLWFASYATGPSFVAEDPILLQTMGRGDEEPKEGT